MPPGAVGWPLRESLSTPNIVVWLQGVLTLVCVPFKADPETKIEKQVVCFVSNPRKIPQGVGLTHRRGQQHHPRGADTLIKDRVRSGDQGQPTGL